MTIEEYRQKSKQGGFDPKELSDAEMFLEPKSWIANGKAEGWEVEYATDRFGGDIPRWKYEMHQMIDALIAGGTIEEFIETL